jgi:hypothetical protein
MLNDGERTDDVIRRIGEEELCFDSPVPRMPVPGIPLRMPTPTSRVPIQHYSEAVQTTRETLDDDMSDMFTDERRSPFAINCSPPTLVAGLDLEDDLDDLDDLDSLIDNNTDTDSLLDTYIRPSTPTCLPFFGGSPRIWTTSDDGMELDIFSPLCTIDGSSLPIDSADQDRKQQEQCLPLASPSPSRSSSRARMWMEWQ